MKQFFLVLEKNFASANEALTPSTDVLSIGSFSISKTTGSKFNSEVMAIPSFPSPCFALTIELITEPSQTAFSVERETHGN